ncbi:MAG: metallophosphoesterase [Candidatus Woesearchaeota archaeon]
MNSTIAVFGDIHGNQDLMYELTSKWEADNKQTIDMILQVGDFETIRNEDDFKQYFAPEKYHHISDISQYCSGAKRAPVFTVFIGGNHEAWGVLKKTNSGGFVCPNIYHLGRSNILSVRGLSIGGLTGIYYAEKYKTPLEEEPGYDWKYYREHEVKNLEEKKVDILLLHEWIMPVSQIDIIKEINIPENCRTNQSTSPAFNLVKKLQPKYVFMGHMHNRYLEGRLNGTKIFGLCELDQKRNPFSMKVISMNSTE